MRKWEVPANADTWKANADTWKILGEDPENELPLSEVIAANVWCAKLHLPQSALQNYSRLKVPWEITLPPEYIYLV